jgi:protease PrsW
MTDVLNHTSQEAASPRSTSTAQYTFTPTEDGHTLPWRWLVVLVTGLALFGAVAATLVITNDPVFIPSLLILGAAVMPVTLTTLVMEAERSSELTLSRVLVAAVLGGVAGAVLAGLGEFNAARALGSLPFLLIGLIEESAKLAVLVVLFSWGRSRGRAVDGLVLGVAVGSGFAALETSGYAFVTLLQSHASLPPVESLLVVRALSSLGGHAAWTGLAAAAWFAIGTAGHRSLGWVRFVAIFATVVCLHALWDATVSSGLYRFVAAGSFVLLAGCAMTLHFRARRPRPLHSRTPVRPEEA